MTLTEVMAALANNTNLTITLLDEEDVQVIAFNAAGYEAIESDLGSRVVRRIKINSGTAISISIEAANTSSSDSTGTSGTTGGDTSGNP